MDFRVAFDFEIEFSNGGGLKGWDFRLDIEGDSISDAELADYIVQDLRLLMVGTVKILNKRILQERHKRAATAVKQVLRVPELDTSAIIDLSPVVRDGQATYPGLPAPSIKDFLSHEDSRGRYAEGVTFQIGRIEMMANSGTSLDAPYHRFPDADDVASFPLSRVVDLDGIVVRLNGMMGRSIEQQALMAVSGQLAGRAVLIETGFSSRWGTPSYFVNHPFLTAGAATYLRDQGVVLVGIDSLNVDDTDDPSRPAHSILLAANIPVVESLVDLQKLPSSGFRFSAAPVRAEGMGAFPVRAWARISG